MAKIECRVCKFHTPIKVVDENISVAAQKEIEKAFLEAQPEKDANGDIIKQKKAVREEKIAAIVAKPEYKSLKAVHGGLSMSTKPTDVDGVYIICTNPDQIKDADDAYAEAARKPATPKNGIVYKYYFKCKYFSSIK